MDLNKITNNATDIIKAATKKIETSKEMLQETVEKQNLTNTPNNPEYWQKKAGIEKITEIELALKTLENKWGADPKRDALVKDLAQNGENAVNSFVQLLKRFTTSIDDDNKTRYKNRINYCYKLVKEFPDIPSDKIKKLDFSLLICSVRKNGNEIFEHIKEVLNSDISLDEKILYTGNKLSKNLTIQEFDSDIYQANYNTFVKFIRQFDDKDSKDALSCCNFTKEEMEKILTLMEDEITKKAIANFIGSSKYCFNVINPVEENINFITKLIDDKKQLKLFQTFITNNLVETKKLEETFNELIKNSASKDVEEISEIIEKLSKRCDEYKPIFSSSYDCNNFFKRINKDNIDSFLELNTDILSETFNDEITQNSILKALNYINPNTNLYDEKIQSMVFKLTNKGIKESDSIELAKSWMDKNNEFSPIAQDLYNYIRKDRKENIISKMYHEEYGYSNKAFALKNLSKNTSNEKIVKITNALKDNEGNFSKENLKHAKDLLIENTPAIDQENVVIALNFIKNQDGIVNKEKAEKLKTLLKENYLYEICNSIKTLNEKFPPKKVEEIFDICFTLNESKELILNNTNSIADYCFTKEGEIIKDKADIVKRIFESSNRDFFVYETDIFKFAEKSKEKEELLIKILNKSRDIRTPELFLEIFKEFKNKDEDLSNEIQNRLFYYIENLRSLKNFKEFHNICLKKDGTFDQEHFEKISNLFKSIEMRGDVKIDAKIYSDIVNGELNPENVNFESRMNLLSMLTRINESAETKIKNYSFLNKAIAELKRYIGNMDIGLPVDTQAKANFLSKVLNSKYSDKLNNFEQTLIDNIPTLEKMTQGIQLTYPRKDFLNDLNKICNDKEKIEILIKKSGITPIIEDDKITGYNGFISLNKFDLNDPFEKKLHNCLHNFMYNNSVNTDNQELNEQLNYIIKACPEFINTIGKKQHGTHKYTVDVHSLLVLANSLNNPAYLKELNHQDKVVLKIASIFHDIGKEEGVIDKTHQYASSAYTLGLLPKLTKNPETKDRIYELISNHHWLEEFDKTSDKTKTSKKLAFKFRRPNDYEISKIMADADLKSVNPEFYNDHAKKLNPTNLSKIEANLNDFYSMGNAIFTERIILPKKLDNFVEEFNGQKYKVINLHKISDDEDLSKFGFRIGLKKKDARFLVHMVDKNHIYSQLETAKLLSSAQNEGVLSESIISPKHTRTYCNRKYGVMISQQNTNIVNECDGNQGSGTKKNIRDALDLIFNSCNKKERSNFKNGLLKNLKIKPSEIKDSEYIEFYKKNLANKTLISEFVDFKEYQLGKYTFNGKQLKEAITKYQDNLIDPKINDEHNEIVGFAPKIEAVIAKEKSLSKVPNELLRFAQENNLPIILA